MKEKCLSTPKLKHFRDGGFSREMNFIIDTDFMREAIMNACQTEEDSVYQKKPINSINSQNFIDSNLMLNSWLLGNTSLSNTEKDSLGQLTNWRILKQSSKHLFYNRLGFQLLESFFQKNMNLMSKLKSIETLTELSTLKRKEIMQILNFSSYSTAKCLYYVYRDDGSQKIDNNYSFVNDPDFVCISASIPRDVVEEYHKKQIQTKKQKDRVNFRQGFLQEWGYLFYSIEKNIYLCNPCPQIYSQLPSHQCFEYAKQNSQIPVLEFGQNIKFQLPHILVDLIPTKISLKSYLSAYNKNENQTEVDGEIVLFVYPWFVEIYALVRKTIENIWELREEKEEHIRNLLNKTRSSQNSKDIRKFNPFRNLHIKYPLKCQTAHNIKIDHSTLTMYYSSSPHSLTTLYALNLANNQTIPLFEKKWFHKNSNKHEYQQIVANLKRIKPITKRISKDDGIINYIKNENTEKSQGFKNKMKDLLQKYLSSEKREKIGKWFHAICERKEESHELQIIQTILCSRSKQLMNLKKVIRRQQTGKHMLFHYQEKYIIQVLNILGSGKQKSFNFQLTSKQSSQIRPLSICLSTCEDMQLQNHHRCIIGITFSTGITNLYEIKEGQILKFAEQSNQQGSTNSFKSIKSIRRGDTEISMRISIDKNKESTIFMFPYQNNCAQIASNLQECKQNYLFAYQDPNQLIQTCNSTTPANTREIFVHATDCGYELFINLRDTDKILSIIYTSLHCKEKKSASQISALIDQRYKNNEDRSVKVGLAMLTILSDISGRYTIYSREAVKKGREDNFFFSIDFSQLLQDRYSKIMIFCYDYLVSIGQQELKSTVCKVFNSPNIKTQKFAQPDELIFGKIQIDSPLAKTAERVSKSGYSEINESKTSNHNRKLSDHIIYGSNQLQTIFMTFLHQFMKKYWVQKLSNIAQHLLIRQFERFLEILNEINQYFDSPLVTMKQFDQEMLEISDFSFIEKIDDFNVQSTPQKKKVIPSQSSNKGHTFVEIIHETVYFCGLISVAMKRSILENIYFRKLFYLRKLEPEHKLLAKNLSSQKRCEENKNSQNFTFVESFEPFLFSYYIDKCEPGLEDAWREVCPSFITEALQKSCRCYYLICPLKNKQQICEKILQTFQIRQKGKTKSKSIAETDRTSMMIKLRRTHMTAEKQRNGDIIIQEKYEFQHLKQIILSKIPNYFMDYIKMQKKIGVRDLSKLLEESPQIKQFPQEGAFDKSVWEQVNRQSQIRYPSLL